jgi:hypothetical protein
MAVQPHNRTTRVACPYPWPRLLAELKAAEAAQETALKGLADAENRLFALPARQRRPLPGWYRAAIRREANTGRALEALSLRIAGTPASGKAGMRAKIRLLASVYGMSPDAPARAAEGDDLAAQLIRSLIVDLGADSSRRR